MDHRLPLRRRATGRLAALAVGALTLLLTGCSNEQAAYPHVGQHEGWTQGSVTRTVLLYVLLPLLLAGAIYGLCLLPGAARRNRYRPQEGWDAEPVWFAGPSDDPVAAVEQAEPGDVVRGGAGGSW